MNKMQVVKIKNINRSHISKKFIVKGRIKPFPAVVEFADGSGVRMIAVLFDKSSCIQIIAFNKDCDAIMTKIQTFSIISIENAVVHNNSKSVITNHKYQLILSSKSVITRVNDNTETIDDFPQECSFINGKQLSSLKPGTFVDVIGKLIYISGVVYHQSLSTRKKYGTLLVDSLKVRIAFFREKADDLYEVGNTFKLYNAQYEFKNREGVLDVKYFTTVVKQEEIQEVQECSIEDLQECRSPDLQESRSADLQESRSADLQESRSADVQESRSADLLECQIIRRENNPTLIKIKEEQPVRELLTIESIHEPSTLSVLTSSASTSSDLDTIQTPDDCILSTSTPLPSSLLLKRNVYHSNGFDEGIRTSRKKLKISESDTLSPLTDNNFIFCTLKLMDDFKYLDKMALQLRVIQMIQDERAKRLYL